MTTPPRVIVRPVTAEEFRAWLPLALAAVGIKPTALSRSINERNPHMLTRFLRDPGREMTLTPAANVFAALQAAADAAGKVLPAIGGDA